MEKKWFRTAIEARARLGRDVAEGGRERLGYGARAGRQPLRDRGRMAHIGKVAASFGISAATLRNYLIALEAYESVADPAVQSILTSYSAVAVAAFGRWHARDPLRPARYVLSHPDANLPEFLAAERAARAPVIPNRRRPRLDDELLNDVWLGPRMQAMLPAPIPEIAQSRIIDKLPPQYRFAGLDHLLLPASSPDVDPHDLWPFGLAGAISVPRFELIETYQQRARGFWQRAVSCALLCPLVLLVFPGPAARRRFLGALPDPMFAHPMTDGEGSAAWTEGPLARSNQGSHPIVFVPGPGLGLILATSLLTLRRDLAF